MASVSQLQSKGAANARLRIKGKAMVAAINRGKANEQAIESVAVIGNGLIAVGGVYAPSTFTADIGSAVDVVNVGRPSAAVYAPSGSQTGVATARASGGSSSSGAVSGTIPAHYLTDHLGTLSDTQAPQFILTNGTRSLDGNLSVGDGVTIDGVDLSAHAVNPNAHHAQLHGIVDAAHHSVTGAQYSIIGLPTANTLGVMATTFRGDQNFNTILRSGTTGQLHVSALDSPRITTPSGADLLLQPATGSVVATGALISTIGGTAGGAVVQGIVDAANSFSRSFFGHNAQWNGTTDLWTIDAIGANDASGLLFRNNAAAIDLVFHSSTGTTGRTMDHATFTAGTKFTFASTGRLGVLNTSPTYEVDVTGRLSATTSVLSPLITTVSGDLTIDPVGAVLFPQNQTIKSVNFNSQFPIAGFQINEKQNNNVGIGVSVLTIGEIQADALSVKVFVADETRIDRGNQIWAKSYGILASDFTVPTAINGTVTVTFEDSPAMPGALFSNGDWLMFQQVDRGTGLTIGYIWGTVAGYTPNATNKEQSWTFTVKYGSLSTVGNPIVFTKGRIGIDWGQSGQAIIALSTVDGSGAPWIKLSRWTGTTGPYDTTTRKTIVAIGDLGSGVGNPFYSPTGDGIWIQPGLSTSRFLVADDNEFRIQGVNLRMYNASSNQTVDLSATDGSLKLGTNISATATTSLNFNGTTGDLRLAGDLYTSDVYLTRQSGITINVGNTDSYINSKAITWYSDINNTTGANPILTIYAAKRTDDASGYAVIDAYGPAQQGKIVLQAQTPSAPHMSQITLDSRVGTVAEPYRSAVTIYSAAINLLSVVHPVQVPNLFATGNITVNGTVDGVDIAAFKTAYDSHNHNSSYYTQSQLNSGQLDSRYYTEGEADSRFVNVSGGTITGTIISDVIRPGTHNTKTIGASTHYYSAGYFNQIYVNQIVGTPTYTHTHSATDINSGVLNLAVIPSILTGKDADTLDGYHASSFSLSSHNHDSVYLKLTGGTLSGGLILDSDATVAGNSLRWTVDSANNRFWFYVARPHDYSVSTEINDFHLFFYDGASWQRVYTVDSATRIVDFANTPTVGGVSVSLVGHNHDATYVPLARTISAGAGLTGGGALSANITISHADTSSIPNVANTNGNVIQSATFDTYGHILTATSVNLDSRYYTETESDARFAPLTRTVSAGAGMSGGGALSADITISHADTSSIPNVANTNGSVIQSATFDTYGHALTATSIDLDSRYYTETESDSRFVNTTGDVMTGALTLTSLFAAIKVQTPLIDTSSGNLTIAPASAVTQINGSVTATSTITAASNLNANNTLGRAIVGFALESDSATFSHFDHNTATNYALAQTSFGRTIVNAPTAQTVDLAINNVVQWGVNVERLLPRGSAIVDIGDYNRQVRTLHATELAVQTLVAKDVISTIGGDVLITPTTKLIADIPSAAGGYGQSSLYTNTVAYWRLEESSGTRYDAKGSNNLTATTVPSVIGKIGTSAYLSSFASLSIADNATLSLGDINFYASGWFSTQTNDGTDRYILFKGASLSGSRAYGVYLTGAAGSQRLAFRAWSSAMASSATVTANLFGNLAINTWYFFEVWHNPSTDLIGVAINRTENTAAFAGGINDDTGAFTIGYVSGATGSFNGSIDEVAIIKNYMPTAAERNYLYNTGSGRTFSDLYAYGTTTVNMDVEHNSLRNGEYVILKTAPNGIPQVEIMRVTSSATAITGGYRYTVARSLDSNTANNWYAGDAVASQQANPGEGHIWLTSTQTAYGHTGPSLIGYVRTGYGVYDIVPTFIKGNLRSFLDYTTDEYGDAAGNNLLLTPSTGFRGYAIDRSNGLRLFNTDIQMYNLGFQTVNINSAGNNVWIGTSAADKRLSWDGTTLGVKGSIDISAPSGFSTGYLQIGTGTKDINLTGWNLSNAEFVGQSAGIDQVVLGTDGKITAGAGAVKLDANGITMTAGTGEANRITFYQGLTKFSELYTFNHGAGYRTVINNTGANSQLVLRSEHGSSDSTPVMISINRSSGVTIDNSGLSIGADFSHHLVVNGGNIYTNGGNLQLDGGDIIEVESISPFSSAISITGDISIGFGNVAATATLDVARGTAGNGTAILRGTTYPSHFNYSTAEHTYIRGGKSTSNVYINDTHNGTIAMLQNRIQFRADDSATNFWIREDGGNTVISTKVGDIYYGYNGRSGLAHKFYPGGSTTESMRIDSVGVNIANSLTISGTIGTVWTDVVFGSGWSNYGVGWLNAQVKKIGDIVIMRGLVKRASGTGTLICTLPSGFRPSGNHMATQKSYQGSYLEARIDIYPDGSVNLITGGADWVSLFNIIFSTI